MNNELIKKYSQPIEDAVDYIEGRRNRSPTKQWNPEQRKKWKLRYPKCPLCNEEYSKANPLTKEHIHPTVLGGYERDENIIPLCEKCNFARNNVMMTVLGTSAIKNIRKRWPIIKPSIQRFIIWCHASIYGDEDALNQFSDLNLEFSRERKITFSFSSNESQPPTSPKEKLSFWKRAEKVARNAMKSTSKSIKSLKPLTKTHQEGIGVSEKIVLQCQGQGCEQRLRISKDHTGNFRCPKCDHVHLGTDSSPDASKTSNAKIKTSIPKNTPLKERSVSKKSKSKTKLAIQGFSSAKHSKKPSLAMPADNRKVCDMLVFIESKRNICNNWVELKELMIASKFDSKTRTEPVHHIYQKSVDQEEDEIDWSKIEEPQVMVELMQKKALQFYSQRESFQNYNTDENRQKIKDYFNEIKEMLSLKTNSKNKMNIQGFSTAGRAGNASLSMPSDVRNVCELLVFIESKRNNCMNWVELLDLMIACNIESKRRTRPVLYQYKRCIGQEGDEIDWSKIEEPQVMAELMQKDVLQIFMQREVLQNYNTDENRQKIKDYFNEIKEMLSLIEVKNIPKELNNNSPRKQEQEEPPVVEINAEKELQKEIPSHKIVAFRTKILDFLNSEEGPVNLQQINKKILIYMKSIGFNSNHVTEFLKLFDIPRGLKKAIEKHMGEEVIITGKHPKFFIQKKVS